jgi:hypothetical protein
MDCFVREQRRYEKSEDVPEEMPELEPVETEPEDEASSEEPGSRLATFVAPQPSDDDEQVCTVWTLADWQLELVPFLKTAWYSNLRGTADGDKNFVETGKGQSPVILGTDDNFARHSLWEFVLRWATTGQVEFSPSTWKSAFPERLDAFLDFCRVGAPPAEYPDAIWRLMMMERWQRASPDPRAPKLSLRQLHLWLNAQSDESSLKQGPGLPSTDPLLQRIPMRADLAKFLDTLISQESQNGLPPAALDFCVADDLDLSEFNGKLVMAGGGALALAFNVPKSDWDLFFVGVPDLDAARALISQAVSKFCSVSEFCATPHAWTYKVRSFEGRMHTVQFVFRGYQSVDEILLGFDVDCCSVVYDGEELWFSERAAHAVSGAVNHVDFDRLSTTYEYRLDKYRKRGFAVRVPGFDSKRIKPQAYDTLMRPYGVKSPGRKSVKLKFSDGALLLSQVSYRRRSYSRHIFRNNRVQHPAPEPLVRTTRLTGLDVLLFLYYSRNRVAIPSDYSSSATARPSFNEEHQTLECPGKYLVANRPAEALIVMCKNPTTPAFEAQLRRCRVWPEFVTRSPGEQVVSSFHRVVLSKPGLWYGSLFYENPESAPREPHVPVSSSRKRVRPTV